MYRFTYLKLQTSNYKPLISGKELETQNCYLPTVFTNKNILKYFSGLS